MKFFILILSLLFISTFCYPQNKVIDSLNRQITIATSDTQRINISVQKLSKLRNINLDTAIAFGNAIIVQAKKIDYKQGEARARISLAIDYCFKGSYDTARIQLDIAKQLLSKVTDSTAVASMYNNYGTMYAMENKYEDSYPYYEKAAGIAERNNDNKLLSSIFQNTAISYQQQSNYSMALEYYQKALGVSEKSGDESGLAYIYLNLGITHNFLGNNKRAEEYYLKALDLGKKLNLTDVETYAYANLSSFYASLKDYEKEYEFSMNAALLGKKMGDKGIQASSLARASLALARLKKFGEAETLSDQALIIADSSGQSFNIYQVNANRGAILSLQKEYKRAIPYFEKARHMLTDADIYSAEVATLYQQLAECYEETGNYAKALSAFKMASKINDSTTSKDNVRKSTELTLNYEFEKKQQLAKAEQARKNTIEESTRSRQYFIIVVLAILILTAIIITIIQRKNNKHSHKANLLLSRQKLKAEYALTELKSAQSQLIQSEKMASLGELTAGIAHEIQNPLNFVNNFSEVNKEMLEELKAERLKPKAERDEQTEDEIINDVIVNSEKINHHGKRAGDIVKGMLQHSQKSTGVKEPTNINALADEYLRLSYHGLRAKDKDFNATMKTDFDSSIGKINIIPQDIGRVLLNLFNNAFYAVNEQKSKNLISYEPTISVITRKSENHVIITVSDNGNGIPQNIVNKIFQPFFTTKPTGQGTGLGLSLSYDIVKAHGGEIKVESKEGEGTEFIIVLPVV